MNITEETTHSFWNVFKAIPVRKHYSGITIAYISRGVLIDSCILDVMSSEDVLKLVETFSVSNTEANMTFHESWEEVRDSRMETLVAEQVAHYFSTYGVEGLGLGYQPELVYLPNKDLDLPQGISIDKVPFIYVRSISMEEARRRLEKVLYSPMAQSEAFIKDLVQVANKLSLPIDFDKVQNKELRTILNDKFDNIPEDPEEFLRLQLYRSCSKTLLIKDKETIEAISESSDKTSVIEGFTRYEWKYGLKGLASVFYRYKPLFLAMKNSQSATTINRIRRLAKKYHNPMTPDYFNGVVDSIRKGTFDLEEFILKLNYSTLNTYRKFKLYQALKFYRNENVTHSKYTIRNGKSFVKCTPSVPEIKSTTLLALGESIAKDLKPQVKGKKFYIDPALKMALPTSGKMFIGDVPFGSSYTFDRDAVVGVYWEDVAGKRIDLDLSMVSIEGKTGWDTSYRNSEFLFSGDVTAAPNGATESFFIRGNAKDGVYLLLLNYYNSHDESQAEVPFKMFVSSADEWNDITDNHTTEVDRMKFFAKGTVSNSMRQKLVGVFRVKDGVKTYYAYEDANAKGITSRLNDVSRNTIKYYTDYLDSVVDFRDVLKFCGATEVGSSEKADIDLSMQSLTKDKIIKLIEG